MSKLPVFGCDALSKALQELGFEIDVSKGKGGHSKAIHKTKKASDNQAPFIIVRGLKEYSDPYFRSRVIHEIMCFDFTRDQIIKAINNNL